MKKSILMIYFILRIQKELYLYFMHFTNIFKQITQILHSQTKNQEENVFLFHPKSSGMQDPSD